MQHPAWLLGLAAAILGTWPAVATAQASTPAAAGSEPQSRSPRPAAAPCQKELSGADFLGAAHARGVAPTSDCLVVDLPSNRFHAPPSSACVLSFDAASWLAPGWQFVRLTGSGRFRATSGPLGLEVRIDAGGGFRLHSVRVVSADPVEAARCGAVRATDVLR
jgi:hypothetical protein